MNRMRISPALHVALTTGALLGLGSCLGPNPGFFISTSAANATIMTLINTLLGAALNTVLGSPGA